VEHAVHVVEDRVLRDRLVAVVLLEGAQGRVRDVVDAFQFGLEQSSFVKDTPVGTGGRSIGGSTGRSP
jgi:hypothetical protein